MDEDESIVKDSDVEFKDRVMLNWKEFRHLLPVMTRSSLIGTVIGIIPAAGTSIAAFLSYDQAKRSSKHPEEFGKGSYEGLIASETANNACMGGAMIPMLAETILELYRGEDVKFTVNRAQLDAARKERSGKGE